MMGRGRTPSDEFREERLPNGEHDDAADKLRLES
jgi:hypothetical protein